MPVRAVALSILVTCLSVAGADAQTLSARLVHTFRGHAHEAQEAAFSPDSQLLATSSIDATVRIWRVADRALVRTIKQPAGITSLDFSPDGQTIVTGSYDSIARVWRVRDSVLLHSLKAHQKTIWTSAFSPDGTMIATGGEDKIVRVWRASDGALLRALPGHALNIWRVAFSPDSKQVISSSFDESIRVWNIAAGKLVRTLTGHTEAVVGLDVKRDVIASSSDDKSVRLWRLSDGAHLRTMTKGNDHVYAVKLSSDAQWVASGGREKGALGTLWKELFGVSEDGSHDPTVRLWRAGDGALMQALADHADDVRFVAFSRDGRWLASSSADKTVKLYVLEVRR